MYGHGSYGHGLYSSYGSSPYYHSSGVKVISPTYKSYYGGGYGSLGGFHGGYSSGYSSGYHGGVSIHGGGLGVSLGGKYGWPLKFGLKYNHWK